METAGSPQASDSSPPQSPPPTDLTGKEPVCYSVEAVLGPQLFKPFPGFFTSPGNHEAAPPSVAHASDRTHSLDPPAESSQSAGSSTFGYKTAPPTVHTIPSALKTDYKEYEEVDEPQEEVLDSKSFQVDADQIPKTQPKLSLASEEGEKLGGEMPAPLKSPRGVKSEENSELPKRKGGTHLLVNYKRESYLPFFPTKSKNMALTPKHPSQPKSHLSVRASDSQTSVKSPRPLAGSSECGAAVPAEPVTSSAENSGSGKSVGQTPAESSSEMTRSGAEIQKSPFYSLFERPITDNITDNKANSDAGPVPQPERLSSKDEDVKSDKPSPFRSLFAAPLTAHSLSPPQRDQPNRSPDTSHSSVSEQRAGTSEERRPARSRSPLGPTSLKSPQHKNEDSESESAKRPTNQVNPVTASSPARGDRTDPPRAQVQQPDATSSKGAAASAKAHSVLKGLFLSLSPYEQEGAQQDSVSSEGEKTEKSNTGCVFSTQQQTQPNDHQSPVRAAPDRTGSWPSPQTPLTSMEATAGSSRGSPEATGAQVSKSGSRDPPSKPVVQPMQQNERPSPRRTSEKPVNGNVDKTETPLKDLFKTLNSF